MKKRIPTLVALFLLLVTTRLVAQLPAQNFSLDEGERVLFVGNSLFENDLPHGYLELALTTRWPDRSVTFRNIGWAGDNVFGEARSYFTNPPTPYELLLKQISDAKPTLVFVAYGGIEAYMGGEGIPDFTKGLNALIDTISHLGAKTVLLSPIPLFSTTNTAQANERNEMLAQYSTMIAQIAASRNTHFIDIFNPMKELGKSVSISDNGFHLNEVGYYHLATLLDQQLGGSSRSTVVSIDLPNKGSATSETAKILKSEADDTILRFEIQSNYLPVPVPKNHLAAPGRLLKITGLKKGYYALVSEGLQVASASATQWAQGVGMLQGPDFGQSEQLQDMIIDKNKLFFHQYRPHNRTYIIGFRSYEQGRHAEGLKELSLIMTWLEGQIALHRAPVSPIYQLRKID